MENSKNYFLENKKNLGKIYKNKNINRVIFSKEIEKLKEKLIKNVKE